MRKIVLTLFTVVCCTVLSAQNRFFTDAGENKLFPTTGQRVIVPEKYRSSSLDMQQMKTFGKAEAFAITLEPEKGNPTPQGPMFVMGKM